MIDVISIFGAVGEFLCGTVRLNQTRCFQHAFFIIENMAVDSHVENMQSF